MKPGLAVAAEAVLWRAKDVVMASEDRDDDSRNDYRLAARLWRTQMGRRCL